MPCFSYRFGHGRRASHAPPSPLSRDCTAPVVRLCSSAFTSSRAGGGRDTFSLRACSDCAQSLLLRQPVNRCDIRGSVQLCAEACGFDHDVVAQSKTRHGQDVACVHDVAAGHAAWGGGGLELAPGPTGTFGHACIKTQTFNAGVCGVRTSLIVSRVQGLFGPTIDTP